MSVSGSGRCPGSRSIQSVPRRRRLFSHSRTIQRRELPFSFGSSPIVPWNLVASTTLSRLPPASAFPTISSDSPRAYTSAVSMKLMPASRARWMIRTDSSWSSLPQAPNIIAPRQSGLTWTPVRPSWRVSIGGIVRVKERTPVAETIRVQPPAPLVLFLAVLMVGMRLLTLVHEVGHAVAVVTLTGQRVLIQSGHDDALIRFAIGKIDFRLDPRTGRDYCRASGAGVTPRQWIAVCLAGPLATLAVSVLVLALLPLAPNAVVSWYLAGLGGLGTLSSICN